eukprot:4533767-Alexandrium_andersonii.AAC.1
MELECRVRARHAVHQALAYVHQAHTHEQACCGVQGVGAHVLIECCSSQPPWIQDGAQTPNIFRLQRRPRPHL